MEISKFQYCQIMLVLAAVILCASCNRQKTIDADRPVAKPMADVSKVTTPEHSSASSPLEQQARGQPRKEDIERNNRSTESRDYKGTLSHTGVHRPSGDPSLPQRISPATQPQSTAAAAYQAAQVRRQAAQAAAKEGELASAYMQSLLAWESLQEHRDVQNCRELAGELLEDLESYGEKLTIRQTGLPPSNLERPVRFE